MASRRPGSTKGSSASQASQVEVETVAVMLTPYSLVQEPGYMPSSPRV